MNPIMKKARKRPPIWLIPANYGPVINKLIELREILLSSQKGHKMSQTNRGKNVVRSNIRASAFTVALDLLIDHLLQMEQSTLPMNEEDKFKIT
jgi:hypothetical protein